MNYYIEVFKVFLGLKRDEIARMFRVALFNLNDFVQFVIALFAVATATGFIVLTFAGVGYLYVTYVEYMEMKDIRKGRHQ